MNGYTNGAHGSDAAGQSRGSGGSNPPIAEIVGSATETVEGLRLHSIKHLLDQARQHFGSAKVMLTNRSPAGAYWEYLVAYQIVAVLIPQHGDYHDKIAGSRSQTHRDYNALLKEISSAEEQFVRIKNIIKNDNLRNGAHHSRADSASSYTRPDSSNGTGVPRRDDELMLPSVPTSAPGGRDSPADSTDTARRKPIPQPKPQSLHGRALHQSSSSINGDLADRFAKLRGAGPPVDTSSARSSQDLSVKMPSPADFQSSNRLVGPRSMPPPPSRLPPRLPLDTAMAASFPKEPSPTYSPARNISLPANIAPPRSTPRSMNRTGGRSNSLAASSVSSYAPNTNGTTDSYFPIQQTPRTSSGRTRSISAAIELEIDAAKLYDYLRMFNVLVIDVRDRSSFDAGHIFVRSVMCLEPPTLQDGDSAEQLYERLIISPDEEQAMFERRHEYDVVVYYNDSTMNTDFLTKHDRNDDEVALKRLYDTLHEFNVDKPLKRPPILLKGGLDAWVDLVGPQALKMSTTAALLASGQTRLRGVRRAPAATHAAKLNLQRRRREYVPMDPEEEQKWLEEARKGRAVVEPMPADDESEEPESPYYRTTEDFLRRFPDVEKGQSMIQAAPRPPPVPQYVAPAIPLAPSRPPPSVPRVSYSGVHERQVAPQGRNNQPPVYISQPHFTNVRMHKTGLINFGVTCYMNSVVQCLSGHLALSDLFLTGRYNRSLQRENWKGTKGILPEAYATLISNLFKGDIASVRPSTFRRICGHFNSQWGVDQQQDAKEFLEFVLDFMHEDLNVTWNKTPLQPLTDQQELQREQFPRQYAAKIEWARYQHRDMSVIGGMFAGQHASQLTCQSCGITSTTYEAFWSLSLEIPRDQACDVRDCLRSYCAAERLAGDELWRCPRCKKDREAVKKITITRAPDTLVVHFKRFSASHNESARKVRTPINFPLQGLDMGPFIDQPMTPEQEAYIARNAKDGQAQLAALKADPTMNGPYIYNAYAVIHHIGATLGSGHYTAFVKDKARGCWRSFNDDKLVDFEPGNLQPKDRLQNERAYIVFYERERVAGGAF